MPGQFRTMAGTGYTNNLSPSPKKSKISSILGGLVKYGKYPAGIAALYGMGRGGLAAWRKWGSQNTSHPVNRMLNWMGGPMMGYMPESVRNAIGGANNYIDNAIQNPGQAAGQIGSMAGNLAHRGGQVFGTGTGWAGNAYNWLKDTIGKGWDSFMYHSRAANAAATTTPQQMLQYGQYPAAPYPSYSEDEYEANLAKSKTTGVGMANGTVIPGPKFDSFYTPELKGQVSFTGQQQVPMTPSGEGYEIAGLNPKFSVVQQTKGFAPSGFKGVPVGNYSPATPNTYPTYGPYNSKLMGKQQGQAVGAEWENPLVQPGFIQPGLNQLGQIASNTINSPVQPMQTAVAHGGKVPRFDWGGLMYPGNDIKRGLSTVGHAIGDEAKEIGGFFKNKVGKPIWGSMKNHPIIWGAGGGGAVLAALLAAGLLKRKPGEHAFDGSETIKAFGRMHPEASTDSAVYREMIKEAEEREYQARQAGLRGPEPLVHDSLDSGPISDLIRENINVEDDNDHNIGHGADQRTIRELLQDNSSSSSYGGTVPRYASGGDKSFISRHPYMSAGIGIGGLAGIGGLGYAGYKYGLPKLQRWWEDRQIKQKLLEEAGGDPNRAYENVKQRIAAQDANIKARINALGTQGTQAQQENPLPGDADLQPKPYPSTAPGQPLQMPQEIQQMLFQTQPEAKPQQPTVPAPYRDREEYERALGAFDIWKNKKMKEHAAGRIAHGLDNPGVPYPDFQSPTLDDFMQTPEHEQILNPNFQQAAYGGSVPRYALGGYNLGLGGSLLGRRLNKDEGAMALSLLGHRGAQGYLGAGTPGGWANPLANYITHNIAPAFYPFSRNLGSATQNFMGNLNRGLQGGAMSSLYNNASLAMRNWSNPGGALGQWGSNMMPTQAAANAAMTNPSTQWSHMTPSSMAPNYINEGGYSGRQAYGGAVPRYGQGGGRVGELGIPRYQGGGEDGWAAKLRRLMPQNMRQDLGDFWGSTVPTSIGNFFDRSGGGNPTATTATPENAGRAQAFNVSGGMPVGSRTAQTSIGYVPSVSQVGAVQTPVGRVTPLPQGNIPSPGTQGGAPQEGYNAVQAIDAIGKELGSKTVQKLAPFAPLVTPLVNKIVDRAFPPANPNNPDSKRNIFGPVANAVSMVAPGIVGNGLRAAGAIADEYRTNPEGVGEVGQKIKGMVSPVWDATKNFGSGIRDYFQPGYKAGMFDRNAPWAGETNEYPHPQEQKAGYLGAASGATQFPTPMSGAPVPLDEGNDYVGGQIGGENYYPIPSDTPFGLENRYTSSIPTNDPSSPKSRILGPEKNQEVPWSRYNAPATDISMTPMGTYNPNFDLTPPTGIYNYNDFFAPNVAYGGNVPRYAMGSGGPISNFVNSVPMPALLGGALGAYMGKRGAVGSSVQAIRGQNIDNPLSAEDMNMMLPGANQDPTYMRMQNKAVKRINDFAPSISVNYPEDMPMPRRLPLGPNEPTFRRMLTAGRIPEKHLRAFLAKTAPDYYGKMKRGVIGGAGLGGLFAAMYG